ncbi:KTSC domain-containing protein [Mesoplasma photuris]|uniref:KTSC domain-containing protein n=1 Tax=Mesoplasma photuris TaxID=217731 RepID=UPI0004E23748|nr:KTSC domain-containing protein [Mesoplasma photuris]
MKILKNGQDFNSSIISQIKFNEDSNHLLVIYKSSENKEYEYCLRDKKIWEELVKAESKGKFIARRLKNKKEYNIYKNNCEHL